MKRTIKLLGVALALAMTVTAVALAAASPGVKTGKATAIGNTTATLNADVNPNGAHTGYSFQYGPTVAYGLTTASRSAGSGTKFVAVSTAVSGLTPGTLYHYRVLALNGSGAATGTDHTFTTTGHPPASVATGPAVSVSTTSATATGSVNPEGQATTWVVQYGLTSYTVQTIAGPPLPAVTTAEPVSVVLSGLAPGKLFHYRIVATHGKTVSIGADQTFFTYPSYRRTPKLKTRTAPSRRTHKPYVFTTSGSVNGAFFVPQALRCTGVVTIRYYNGKHQVAFTVTQVEPNCGFSTPVSFRRLIGGGPTALRVAIRYRGNGYLKPVTVNDHVTLG
jgi:phosphodiesterase/alkaline phosphatase D-like protein